MRDTVGKICAKLLEDPKPQQVGETSDAMLEGYMDEVQTCAQSGIDHGKYEGDFYVCALRRCERLITNIIRMQYYHRQTRPTPMWDMDCFRVTQQGDLFYCWSLPDQRTGMNMITHPEIYLPEFSDLVKYVTLFSQDKLI